MGNYFLLLFMKPCKKENPTDSIYWREEKDFLPGDRLPCMRLPFMRRPEGEGRHVAESADQEIDFSFPPTGVLATSRGKQNKRAGQGQRKELCRTFLNDSRSTKFKCDSHYEPRNVLAPISPFPHRRHESLAGPFCRGRNGDYVVRFHKKILVKRRAYRLEMIEASFA